VHLSRRISHSIKCATNLWRNRRSNTRRASFRTCSLRVPGRSLRGLILRITHHNFFFLFFLFLFSLRCSILASWNGRLTDELLLHRSLAYFVHVLSLFYIILFIFAFFFLLVSAILHGPGRCHYSVYLVSYVFWVVGGGFSLASVK